MLRLIFPFYHLLVLFIIPILVVLIGFKYNTEYSADLSLIYSIIFVVFFPLNGNVRHYILNTTDNNFILNLVYFRFLSYLPLLAIAFGICFFTIDADIVEIVIIVLIASFYWLNEIFVSNAEKEKSFSLVIVLTFIYVILIIYTIFNNAVQVNFTSIFITYILSFLLITLQFLKKYSFNINFSKLKNDIYTKILPQIGGTFVIGFSTLIFKLIILFFLSKSVAGSIFISFTLSGVFLTFFTYGIGPSLILSEITKKDQKTLRYLKKISYISVLTGLTVIFVQSAGLIEYEWIMNQEIFLYCTGLCLLGIPSSIIAQYYKLCVIHQNLSMKIYKYDSIPNISILLCVLIVLNYYEPYYIGLTYIYTGTITYIIYKRLFKKIISKNLN